MKSETVTIRLSPELLARLRAASDKGRDPYAPSMTAILERGAELALRELKPRWRRNPKT